MKYTITIASQQLPILIRKHHSAKRISLRYNHTKNSVSLTIPRHSSVRRAIAFAHEKTMWLEAQIQQYQTIKTQDITENCKISVLGEELTIKHSAGRGIASKIGSVLYIHGEQDFMKRRLQTWLKNLCKTEIISFSDKFASQIGVRIKKITLRDTRSRWGSCSTNGSLSFSWRLVFAPHNVLEYVVAHEVAHLLEHNHSPAFWNVVANLCPNWKNARYWLKQNGKTLHMINL